VLSYGHYKGPSCVEFRHYKLAHMWRCRDSNPSCDIDGVKNCGFECNFIYKKLNLLDMSAEFIHSNKLATYHDIGRLQITMNGRISEER